MVRDTNPLKRRRDIQLTILDEVVSQQTLENGRVDDGLLSVREDYAQALREAHARLLVEDGDVLEQLRERLVKVLDQIPVEGKNAE